MLLLFFFVVNTDIRDKCYNSYHFSDVYADSSSSSYVFFHLIVFRIVSNLLIIYLKFQNGDDTTKWSDT